MGKLIVVLGALGIGIAGAMPSSGPAGADGPVPATAPVTTLQVVIGPPQGPGPSERTEPVVVLLRCDLPGNEHPYPVEACAEVEAAKGDIDAIPAGNSACTDVWQPVQISVSGVVADEPVRWSDQVSNEGCAVSSHGHVFMIPLEDPSSPTEAGAGQPAAG